MENAMNEKQTTTVICPVCQRAVKRRADGRIARHGYRAPRNTGMRLGSRGCITSGWGSMSSAVEHALTEARAHLASLPASDWSIAAGRMRTRADVDFGIAQDNVRALERALARCPKS
jgi:hypothetical protein